MREILFRGKHFDTGEWIEGLPSRQSDGVLREIERLNFEKLTNGVAAIEYIEVKEETVCQYTGLTDNNGRKIFEGDIVKHDISDTIGTVKWYCEDYAGWCVDDIHIGEQQFTDEMWNECEVIGNIFDNPELLN